MIHFWEDYLMPNENVLAKIWMDKPILFCLQCHLRGLFVSFFSGKCVSRPAGGSSVSQRKLLAWKCDGSEQADYGPVSTETQLPFLHPQLERLVFEILSTVYASCIALFDVCSLQEWLSYEFVDLHMFFIVLFLEGKYMESQHSEWSCDTVESIQVTPTGAWMDIATRSLGYWPDSSWLGHWHFVGVIWFGILEYIQILFPNICYGNKVTKTRSLLGND